MIDRVDSFWVFIELCMLFFTSLSAANIHDTLLSFCLTKMMNSTIGIQSLRGILKVTFGIE